MRSKSLIALAALALAAMTAPAEAAWKSYVSHALGFSFQAPGEVKALKVKYRGAVAGEHDAVAFRSIDDNIEYKVTVVDFAKRADEGAVIMEEAAYILQEDKHMLMNDFGRVEPGKDAVYGRKMAFDMPNNGGRKTVATYFTKGKLYMLEATVLPANGDYASPDAGRFVDSLVFVLSRSEQDATELQVPN
ncbi:MAG TPA: hypothetical protein VNH44_16270 [Micropepsaceae bacterium]|nr:hypothetical protein [Micropepsaceae bacterium]